jgi:hypothetical protein
MKVVNIPSTKMMKKFLRICARSSLHRLVPIHAIVLNFSRHCEPTGRANARPTTSAIALAQ